MRYKNGKGVGDINISVDNGEVKGLLGPNGAGKSTTMRSLMGFLIPSQGILSVEGINTIENPVEAKKNNRIFTWRSSTSTKFKF